MPALGSDLSLHDRIRGALFGGAIGDALGAGIEFMTLADIREEFGRAGLRDYLPAYGRRGAITDDTQMTLFTAEGLLRSWVRMNERGICHTPGVVHHAYLRWLLTQGERPKAPDLRIATDGWLYATEALHARRSPGTTCVSALVATRGLGTPMPAVNRSKGCGGVMRVAPVGLIGRAYGTEADVFTLGCDTAALTHGHPAGFLAAGYAAVLIAALTDGASLDAALDRADATLAAHAEGADVRHAVAAARRLAAQGDPTPEKVETLGGGWVAEEALAIAVYCALAAPDFRAALLLAVNHSGDSDSTGSITGQILGARDGLSVVPADWLAEIEVRETIERIATDLDAVATGRTTSDALWDAYPGH